MPAPARSTYRLLLAALLLAPAAACDNGPAGPAGEEDSAIVVDASAGWAFVRLGSPARTVAVTDPSSSSDWDIAFNATSVMLNGGQAGPGGVEAYCLCQNGAVTPQQVQGMTAASERGDFEAATAAQIPSAATAWATDSASLAVTGWYRYDLATHTVAAAADRTWKLRLAARAGQDTAYAKLRVTAMEGATREHAGRVTVEYAVQPRKGAAMGAVQTRTVDLSAGAASLDLLGTGGTWDVRLSGYEIRVNGGASGAGNAGAALADAPFAQVADASDLVAQQYVRDATSGVFSRSPWYLYNVTGNDHQIWPTFQVYLLRRGTTVYKVQVAGYYGPAGETRRITLRYAPLAG
jgi:hypothetical protein